MWTEPVPSRTAEIEAGEGAMLAMRGRAGRGKSGRWLSLCGSSYSLAAALAKRTFLLSLALMRNSHGGSRSARKRRVLAIVDANQGIDFGGFLRAAPLLLFALVGALFERRSAPYFSVIMLLL